jgi:hypothetical protein
MFQGFSEPDTRIQDNLFFWDSGFPGFPGRLKEKVFDLFQYIPILGILLHGSRFSLHMHQATPGSIPGRNSSYFRFKMKG